jgi:hypothetical protein
MASRFSGSEVLGQALVDLGLAVRPSMAGSSDLPMVAVGYLPDTPDSVVALYDYEGRPDFRNMEGETREHHNVQVRVRAVDYPTARAAAFSIQDELDKIRNREVTLLDQVVILKNASRKTSGIKSLGADDRQRCSVVTNFKLCFSNKT